ncbi:MAG TPA: glycine--tRNA ligase subunit beta [Actinomycetota bacterium]|nr:glycine--tRNA ligase subunit beta [Actinomycetota bacterium]
MADLLLEIGTEELPPSAITAGEPQLLELATRLLGRERLAHGAVDTFATPRRLAVLVRDVAQVQEAVSEERRGPPASRAFTDLGEPSEVGIRFARSNGVDPSQLQRRSTPQGDYAYVVRQTPARPALDLLPDVLSEMLGSLSFQRTMRWDDSGVKFPRPIRWIVALFGDKVVPFVHGRVAAGRQSVGHRVFHPGPVEITDAASYESQVRDAGVLAKISERREEIVSEAQRAADSMGGTAIAHDRIVDEVTRIVERPVALTGTFDPGYLELPRAVLTTSMETHLRHIAVQDRDGSLLPGFVVVSNADPGAAAMIAHGNERVLRARLEDARFFFAEDRKVPLQAYARRLNEVVVHARLGSLADRARRMTALLPDTVGWSSIKEGDARAAAIAAPLVKADLLTHMVGEFPELQGEMGAEYALRDSDLAREAGDLLPAVALAVREHYLPRFAGDAVPSSPAGSLVGLLDRLDTLVGYVGIGLLPTGSADPYALRRAAAGFAAICIATGYRIPISDSVARLWEGYRAAGADLQPLDACLEGVSGLLSDRTQAILEREGVAAPFVSMARGSAWTDLPDLAARARAVAEVHASGGLKELVTAHERPHNILRKAGGVDAPLDRSMAVHPAERDLLQTIDSLAGQVTALAAERRYAEALSAAAPLAAPMDRLFDRDAGVMVNDPNEKVRHNRLALLAAAVTVLSAVADLSAVEPKELDAVAAGPGHSSQ